MFDELSKLAQEKAGQLSELLDISDQIAKGEKEPHSSGQYQFLKLSIDTRLRMLERVLPQKVENSHTGNVRFEITRGESLQSTPDSTTSN